MRRILLVTFFVALFSFIPASARVGETEEQCIARYGQPTQTVDADKSRLHCRMLYFAKEDYWVVCAFLNGYCGSLAVQKKDKTDLSDNEVQVLLQYNSGGYIWKKSVDPSTNNSDWLRDDGFFAYYDIQSHMLVIMSKDFVANQTAKQKSAETPKLNGF